jgi:hypothetical protein
MRYAVVLTLVSLLFTTPLEAQDSNRLAPMLQYVIDLPEMEQVYSDLGITEKLCLVQTSVVPPEIHLVRSGRNIDVHEDRESAFYLCEGAFVQFTDISVMESSTTTVHAFVHGPKTHPVGDGINVSLVLEEQSERWNLKTFRRGE